MWLYVCTALVDGLGWLTIGDTHTWSCPAIGVVSWTDNVDCGKASKQPICLNLIFWQDGTNGKCSHEGIISHTMWSRRTAGKFVMDWWEFLNREVVAFLNKVTHDYWPLTILQTTTIHCSRSSICHNGLRFYSVTREGSSTMDAIFFFLLTNGSKPKTKQYYYVYK